MKTIFVSVVLAVFIVRSTPAKCDELRVPLFVAMEWRGAALAEHLGNGPGGRIGLSLWHGHLRTGLLMFARSGPLNPTTFEVNLPEGQTYKGQDSLKLRSDHGHFGIFVEPVFRIPGTQSWFLELPLSIGQGGGGFYLSGEDRKTPDGRRVSEWENELFAGRDSSIVLGLDGGVRVAYGARSWVAPYAAAHYTASLGFDTLVRQGYDGFSLAAGIQMGAIGLR